VCVHIHTHLFLCDFSVLLITITSCTHAATHHGFQQSFKRHDAPSCNTVLVGMKVVSRRISDGR